ncbi:hypothetical protein GGR28_000478 [Lewinella aquimaris]|uniref:LTD domain-containing protein n=1 Tax=Neolewinella aquimaris TaxID=1835722 RepID=A0A840E454_9BACT|nr:lamin tail domain-containing protein [Neolewinella aquimaris]MBB4077877.1 hypothetical protein [Neolewinella aquimaris]
MAPVAAQELMVTEIMADPTPSQGLPAAEYLELYNAGSAPVDLTTLQVASGGAPRPVASTGYLLPAGGYAVIVDHEVAEDFTAFDVTVLSTDLPGLTNGGDEVSIYMNDRVVVSLNYTDDWYQDKDRDDGGYSLEYTGRGAVNCGGNWRASVNVQGGTPGRPNSVVGQPADNTPPQVVEYTVDPFGVVVTFDEDVVGPADHIFLLNGDPVRVNLQDGRTFNIRFDPVAGRVDTLAVLPDYADCAGNFPTEIVDLFILLPVPTAPGDVVINEVLFDPGPNEGDYVELVNVSDHAIDLRNWGMSNVESSQRPKSLDRSILLLPQDFLVLAEDRAGLLGRFPRVDAARVLEVDLPPLPNERGNFTLATGEGIPVDAFTYGVDMHAPLLSSVEGVSLERLHTDAPTQEASNWYSAAGTAGYGTPTLPNSQAPSSPAQVAESVKLVERIFSPDGDGHDDVLEIAYRTAAPGAMARLTVFDSQGAPVVDLQPTVLLGAEGVLEWNGTDASGRIADPGAYILLVEVFDPNGRTDRYKLLAVLAG